MIECVGMEPAAVRFQVPCGAGACGREGAAQPPAMMVAKQAEVCDLDAARRISSQFEVTGRGRPDTEQPDGDRGIFDVGADLVSRPRQAVYPLVVPPNLAVQEAPELWRAVSHVLDAPFRIRQRRVEK